MLIRLLMRMIRLLQPEIRRGVGDDDDSTGWRMRPWQTAVQCVEVARRRKRRRTNEDTAAAAVVDFAADVKAARVVPHFDQVLVEAWCVVWRCGMLVVVVVGVPVTTTEAERLIECGGKGLGETKKSIHDPLVFGSYGGGGPNQPSQALLRGPRGAVRAIPGPTLAVPNR